VTPVASPQFVFPDQGPLSKHCSPCAAAVTHTTPVHDGLLSHAALQTATVDAAFRVPLSTFVFLKPIQRRQPERTHKYLLNSRCKAGVGVALRDGDVFPFVCSIISSSVANEYWSVIIIVTIKKEDKCVSDTHPIQQTSGEAVTTVSQKLHLFVFAVEHQPISIIFGTVTPQQISNNMRYVLFTAPN